MPPCDHGHYRTCEVPSLGLSCGAAVTDMRIEVLLTIKHVPCPYRENGADRHWLEPSYYSQALNVTESTKPVLILPTRTNINNQTGPFWGS